MKKQTYCTCYRTCYYGHYRKQYGSGVGSDGYRCDYCTIEGKPRTASMGKKVEQGRIIDGKCGFYITPAEKNREERKKREMEAIRKAEEREKAKLANQIDLNVLLELHKQGLPNDEIMKRTGCSTWYLNKGLKQLGLKPNRKHNDRYYQMLRLYQSGALDSEIAEVVGISVRSVNAWRLRAGLPSNFKRGEQKK